MPLKISAFKKSGVLRTGAAGTCRWGESFINFETRWDDMLVLSWIKNEEGQTQYLGFQWLAHKRNFGGYQYYFVCPRCMRPCNAVYFWGKFACRKCHKLPYISQRLGTLSRLDRRIDRLEIAITHQRRKRRENTLRILNAAIEKHNQQFFFDISKRAHMMRWLLDSE